MLSARQLSLVLASCVPLAFMACTLSTGGLCTEKDVADCGNQGGSGGEMTSSSSSGGGEGGTGGSNSTTSSSSSGNTGGSGGGTTSSSSSGGGGMGGSSSVNCEPGLSGPYSVNALGITEYGTYFRDNNNGEQYFSSATPGSIDLTNKPYPGELVVGGKDGVSVSFTGGTAKFYSVNVSPVPSCNGSNFYTKPCLSDVGHYFRCFHGSNEPSCAGTLDVFTLIGDQAFYATPQSTQEMVLASPVCQ